RARRAILPVRLQNPLALIDLVLKRLSQLLHSLGPCSGRPPDGTHLSPERPEGVPQDEPREEPPRNDERTGPGGGTGVVPAVLVEARLESGIQGLHLLLDRAQRLTLGDVKERGAVGILEQRLAQRDLELFDPSPPHSNRGGQAER